MFSIDLSLSCVVLQVPARSTFTTTHRTISRSSPKPPPPRQITLDPPLVLQVNDGSGGLLPLLPRVPVNEDIEKHLQFIFSS